MANCTNERRASGSERRVQGSVSHQGRTQLAGMGLKISKKSNSLPGEEEGSRGWNGFSQESSSVRFSALSRGMAIQGTLSVTLTKKERETRQDRGGVKGIGAARRPPENGKELINKAELKCFVIFCAKFWSVPQEEEHRQGK